MVAGNDPLFGSNDEGETPSSLMEEFKKALQHLPLSPTANPLIPGRHVARDTIPGRHVAGDTIPERQVALDTLRGKLKGDIYRGDISGTT
ncbi:hypothetical protein Tco_0948620 [Tanacetum coccineum]